MPQPEPPTDTVRLLYGVPCSQQGTMLTASNQLDQIFNQLNNSV
jgi:hypothetical protein